MAAPPPVLTLAVEKGPREGETRKCRVGAALRVGRVASGNDLAVRDVGASQRHLTIEFLPPPASRWAVSDLGSSNGTFINGARLLPSVLAPLSHGDLIVLGQSTVLGVSIAPDSDVKPGPRRSSRLKAAVAVVEEKQTPSVTRLSTRKMVGTRAAAAALEPSETEKEGLDAAAAVVEEESHRVVTRGGGRKKVAGAESLKEGKEEMEEAAVATLCGRRKKAVEAPELEKADEQKEEKAAVATRGRKRKKAVESPEPEKADEQKEENAVATRGRKRKKSVEFPELENADEQKEEKAAMATRGWKRKKAEPSEPEKGDEGKEEAEVVTCRDRREVAPTVAPPPLPPKTRSRRVQGRVTRARARKAVLEEEEEVAAPREKEKSDKVAAGDEEVEGTANALEEVPVAQRGLARRAPKGMINTECAASDNGGKEINEGGGEEENGKMEAVNIEGELEDDEKGEKHAGRSSLDTITLQEWFERMERYLPRMINEAADEMIATLEEKHRRINEYISVLRNSCDPLEIHEYCIVRSDGQSNAE